MPCSQKPLLPRALYCVRRIFGHRLLLLGVGLLLIPGRAEAQPPPGPAQNSEPVQLLVKEALQRRTAHLPGTATIKVDAEGVSRFPACSSLHIPAASRARLRPKMSVRIECQAPQRWATYVAATVAVHGSYVITSRTVQAGQKLDRSNLALQQGELIGLPSDTLFRLDEAVGQTAARRLRAGQPVQIASLRRADMIAHGQKVRVVVQGNGFTAASEAESLGSAVPGAPLRVRTASGKIITGIVTEGGTVEITM